MYLSTTEGITRYGSGSWSMGDGGTAINQKMYGIIVLAIIPFIAFFACGWFFAKRRYEGYAAAQTKETELTAPVSHTSV